jgi:hypothetical protein
MIVMKAYRVHRVGLYSVVQQQRDDFIVAVTCRLSCRPVKERRRQWKRKEE